MAAEQATPTAVSSALWLYLSASITAEKSWSLRPSDFAALYSSFAAATVGMDWDTDSARANASLMSCHELFVSLLSGALLSRD